jgi:excisionase family DNA binding protein
MSIHPPLLTKVFPSVTIPLDMFTIDELATKLKVHRNTVKSLIESGDLVAIRVGNQYRIPEESYNEFISMSEVKPDQQVAGSKVI